MVSPTDLIQHYKTGLAQTGSAPSAHAHPRQCYQCQREVNIYDSPQLKALATQAAATRQLRILSLPNPDQGHPNAADLSSPVRPIPALPVCLYEDDYPGWLNPDDLAHLQPAAEPHPVPQWQASDIRDRIPAIIAYMKQAMAQPNEYLWGGTLGPNYDCSGLMQAAFRSVGIWLPRDAYQQEAFTQTLALGQSGTPDQRNQSAPSIHQPQLDQLDVGDLIFFGPKEKANHVALYLGDGHYIHSSGKDMGRNGIGIDVLFENGDPVSQSYLRQVHGGGRVVTSYQPKGQQN